MLLGTIRRHPEAVFLLQNFAVARDSTNLIKNTSSITLSMLYC